MHIRTVGWCSGTTADCFWSFPASAKTAKGGTGAMLDEKLLVFVLGAPGYVLSPAAGLLQQQLQRVTRLDYCLAEPARALNVT